MKVGTKSGTSKMILLLQWTWKYGLWKNFEDIETLDDKSQGKLYTEHN